ncbi:site-specific integrase [Lentzea tibetensis]|uniref:hypothetical protein n=1 Tax=Lentzea tibetensis TaxID=2591470 RepID=UPI001C99C8D8|nr:hypothetical protein [Lentzea tibetensis]
MLQDLGQVGLWLSAAGLQVNELSEERLEDFLAVRRAARRRVPGIRGMAPLLTFLRESGAVSRPQSAPTPLKTLLEEFRSWMEKERGLAAATVLRYENTARCFLTEQAMTGGDLTPARLSGADLNAFLLRECARVSAGSAKGRVAELRALMRFLHLRGVIPLRLGRAVPPVGGWRFATVPPTIAAADIQLLLDHCPRTPPSASATTRS